MPGRTTYNGRLKAAYVVAKEAKAYLNEQARELMRARMQDAIGRDRMGPKTAVAQLPIRLDRRANQILTEIVRDGMTWEEPEESKCGKWQRSRCKN